MTPAWIPALTLGVFVVGAVLMALSSRSVAVEERRARWLEFATYFLVVHLVVAAALLGRSWLLLFALLITAGGAWEIRRAIARLQGDGERRSIKVVYLIVAVAFMVSILTLPPLAAVFLYLVVAAFDGFSQVIGQLAGRRLLAPRVSPHKTFEGLCGGIVGAMVIAVLLGTSAGIAIPAALLAGAVIAVCALAGDLCASWLKRRVGIKDFGAILPGQGGVLDRFDSFIAAGALAGPLLRWITTSPAP